MNTTTAEHGTANIRTPFTCCTAAKPMLEAAYRAISARSTPGATFRKQHAAEYRTEDPAALMMDLERWNLIQKATKLYCPTIAEHGTAKTILADLQHTYLRALQDHQSEKRLDLRRAIEAGNSTLSEAIPLYSHRFPCPPRISPLQLAWAAHARHAHVAPCTQIYALRPTLRTIACEATFFARRAFQWLHLLLAALRFRRSGIQLPQSFDPQPHPTRKLRRPADRRPVSWIRRLQTRLRACRCPKETKLADLPLHSQPSSTSFSQEPTQ